MTVKARLDKERVNEIVREWVRTHGLDKFEVTAVLEDERHTGDYEFVGYDIYTEIESPKLATLREMGVEL